MFFPIPDVLLLYLQYLGVALPQMTPNILRLVLCTFMATAETIFLVSVTELLKLFNVHDSRASGMFTAYPNLDRNLIHGLPSKDEDCGKSWFLFKIDTSSVDGLADMVQRGWATVPGKIKAWFRRLVVFPGW